MKLVVEQVSNNARTVNRLLSHVSIHTKALGNSSAEGEGTIEVRHKGRDPRTVFSHAFEVSC